MTENDIVTVMVVVMVTVVVVMMAMVMVINRDGGDDDSDGLVCLYTELRSCRHSTSRPCRLVGGACGCQW